MHDATAMPDTTPGRPAAAAASGRFRDVFTNEKSFDHRWIGSRPLNALGLHAARVRIAAACQRWRLAQAAAALDEADRPLARRLAADGLLVVPDALPPALFEAARAEFRARLDESERLAPPGPPPSRGYGDKVPHAFGFDRYDGASLNRFLPLGDAPGPLHEAFGPGSAFARRVGALSGVAVRPSRIALYRLVHGDEAADHDLQRDWHCDSFFATWKLWFFFDDVGPQDGPFLYAAGTHRHPRARLRLETRRAVDGPDRSASFRYGPEDLAALGGSAPQPVTVAANTWVLADTRGLHARGPAPAGTRRDSLYVNLRPRAFGLRAGR